MASGLYANFKQQLLSGGFNLPTDDIRCILISNAAYTVNLATHVSLSDVPAGARIAATGSLTSKTVTGGVFNAANPTIASVSGATTQAILIYRHTGVDSTALLIAYVDNVNLTPNGSSVTIAWDTGSSKVFAL